MQPVKTEIIRLAGNSNGISTEFQQVFAHFPLNFLAICDDFLKCAADSTITLEIHQKYLYS